MVFLFSSRLKPTVMKKFAIARGVPEKAVKKISPLAKKKKIAIKTSIKNGRVKGQISNLIELFVILLDNAIKYSPKKSKVEIYSKHSKNEVKILVQDAGFGISDEDLGHIYDRFYRAEKSRSHDGYGLGLSIAKKIVKAHRGSINALSEINKGTTFTITLPA